MSSTNGGNITRHMMVTPPLPSQIIQPNCSFFIFDTKLNKKNLTIITQSKSVYYLLYQYLYYFKKPSMINYNNIL